MSNETEWVLVPREPTKEMLEKGGVWNTEMYTPPEHEVLHCIWRDMLAAAPQPPAEAQAQGGGEFGVGIQPNPKARYWQDRAEFWRTQAVALGWREKRDAANGEAPPPSAPEAQAEPNWCRTCGRRPHDPVAALCPDTHHRKASPPSAPVGVEVLRDLRDRVLPAALRYHATGPGYIEEAQEIVTRALAAQQPAPVEVDGFPPDVQEIIRRDEAAWALAERAEAAGAERDSDDNETWWTLRIEQFYALAQQSAAVDGAMVDEALRSWFECDDWPSLLAGIEGVDRCRSRMLRALTAALAAQQPAATLPDEDDSDLTVAYMAGRHDGRKEAQQHTTVDALNAWRAAFVEERATRYREGGMAIEQARIHAETDAACIDADALAAQQPAPVEVDGFPPDVQEIIRRDEAAWALAERAEAAGAERDSDDNETWWTLRIEQFYALAQQSAAVDEAMVERALAEWKRLEGHQTDAVRMSAALQEALAAQPGGSDNDR